MTLRFLAAEFLWLLLLVPLLWWLPRRLRDFRHGLLRTLVMASVVLALARPMVVVPSATEHHVVVLDASPSADAVAVREAVRLVDDRLPAAADTTLLVVGTVTGLDLADPGAHVDRVAAIAPDGGSPLAAALAAAARRIPAGARGAVTLVSDGLATDRRHGPILTELEWRGIPVHALELPRHRSRARPVGLACDEELRVGQTARVRVTLIGPGADVVTLRHGDEVLAQRELAPFDGRGEVELTFEPLVAGFPRLTVDVRVDDAGATTSLTRTFAVQDPWRVLYLGERQRGGATALGTLVGPGFQIDAPQQLEGATAPDLGGYDLVFLDDRRAASVPAAFQRELVRGVVDHGLGLVASGGLAAFGPGGYHQAPLETLLPVELVQKEEKKDPSTALAVIIDTSGSMAGERIRLAKEVTRLAIRRLLPHDKIGIVEFYGNKRWAAPLQSAANAIDIQRALNRLDAGGGTILLPAVEEAYYGLRNVQTRYKHVLVLTDAGVETGPYESLLRRMARDGMCVSTVLVGPGRHSEFLVQIADWGNGRYYNASDRFNLPEILLKQPSTSRISAYRPGVHPVRAQGGPGWWGEVDPRATPPLDGYVETRARQDARVLLETAADGHPIVASWRYGLGRVTAITTEPVGAGTESWRAWDGYGSFLARILTRTSSDVAAPFAFSLARDDEVVEVQARRLERGEVRPRARTVTGDTELRFEERAPGRFVARFPWDPDQEVRVLCGPVDARRLPDYRLVSDARSDVAPELAVDPAAALDLAAVARATGGVFAPAGAAWPSALGVGGGDAAEIARDLAPWCLLFALLCLLAELVYRRLPSRVRFE